MIRIAGIRWRGILLVTTLIVLTACGGEDENPVGAVQPDVPGQHLVMIRNQTEFMWIGTNSDSIGTLMQQYASQKARYWIGGKVIPEPQTIQNFYFHPTTVQIADSIAEDMQTTIDQISGDPQYYAIRGEPSEYTEHAWFVLGECLAYQEAEE